MSLKGKNVIVTGGTGGIGKAMIEYFAKAGANVVFSYRKDEDTAKLLLDKFATEDIIMESFQLNVSDKNGIKKFVKFAASTLKNIDILVNNAGIRRDKSILYMEDEDWQSVLETNLYGVFYMSRAFVPYMLKQRSGRIINISSISGINGMAGQVNYSSSKAGIFGFTKALAKELVSFGISVNAIAPGPVDTGMLIGMPEDKKKDLINQIPARRVLKPEEVAMVAGFLADNQCCPEYLTGQVITLDGGMGL